VTAPLETITFARPADGRTTLAKVLHVQGGRIVGKDPSPNVATFRYVERPVLDLHSLFSEVQQAAEQGVIAVRAKPKELIGNRRIHDREDGPPNLEVVPRRWCAFDWDGLPLELQPCPNPKWSWQPDPLLEPWIGAQIALRRLPPAFRDVSCFWQATSGPGFNEGFRLRTWHWLDMPVIGAELKTWLKPAIERGIVDPVTLVECQPHYLGVQIQGGLDPCPRRFGLLELPKSEVPVPDIDGIRRRQIEAEIAKRPPELRRPPKDPSYGDDYARHRIDQCLEAIRNSAFGARHPTYTAEAARAKALCDRYGLAWSDIRRELASAYETTLTPEEARARRSFSTEGVLRWLDGRSAT
jgi:hypothetical protein